MKRFLCWLFRVRQEILPAPDPRAVVGGHAAFYREIRGIVK